VTNNTIGRRVQSRSGTRVSHMFLVGAIEIGFGRTNASFNHANRVSTTRSLSVNFFATLPPRPDRPNPLSLSFPFLFSRPGTERDGPPFHRFAKRLFRVRNYLICRQTHASLLRGHFVINSRAVIAGRVCEKINTPHVVRLGDYAQRYRRIDNDIDSSGTISRAGTLSYLAQITRPFPSRGLISARICPHPAE